MSIGYDYGHYAVYCDYCGAQLLGEESFYAAVQAKKAAGWKSMRDSGEWLDICPECLSEMRQHKHGGDGR